MQGRGTEGVYGGEKDEFSHVDGFKCPVSMNITPLSVSKRDTSSLTVQLHETTFVNPTSSTTSSKKSPSHSFEMV